MEAILKQVTETVDTLRKVGRFAFKLNEATANMMQATRRYKIAVDCMREGRKVAGEADPAEELELAWEAFEYWEGVYTHTKRELDQLERTAQRR